MSQPFSQMTTAAMTLACQDLLTSLGYTNVTSAERWEGDGVIEIAAGEVTIEVSGTDLADMFPPGATVRVGEDDDDGSQADDLAGIRAILVTMTA